MAWIQYIVLWKSNQNEKKYSLVTEKLIFKQTQAFKEKEFLS